MKILKPDQFQHKQLRNIKTGQLYSFSQLVTEYFGARQIFLTHDIIKPQAKASAPHRHSHIEEIVFVAKGFATLCVGEKKEGIREGSFIYFDPRETALHLLMNESDSDVETITFSVQRSEDNIIYDNTNVWLPPTLETDRLLLRPLSELDAASIFAYAKNPNVSKYTLWEPHKTEQDSLNYLKQYVFPYYQQGVPEPLAITFKENDQKVIGTVGCFWSSKSAKAMELAYAVSEDYWGQGLVVEASKAVMDYCFKEFSLKRIQARCKAENKASTRVMEKVGMTYEGTLKSAIFHRNKYFDMVYFAKVME